MQPPLLADRIASLRIATAASSHRGWLLSSLHALILAIFDRVLGRLEHILLLWQAGQLPLHAPREPAPHAPGQHRPQSAATPRPAPHPARRRARATKPAQASATPTHARPASTAPRGTRVAASTPPRPHIRPARAPPRAKTQFAPAPTYGQFVAITQHIAID